MIETPSISSKIATTVLPVMEAFYTLQGEGFHQGKAAYFIRLGGCDVGCVWCDVKESWEISNHPKKKVKQIVEEANGLTSFQSPVFNKDVLPAIEENLAQATENNKLQTSNHKPFIVITGGEPLMHNLTELTAVLQQNGFQTHLETSGTYPLTGSWNWICLSPKKFKTPLSQIFQKANELKIVVYNKADFKWAEQNAVRVPPECRLYLQPEWSKCESITPLLIEYIKTHPQWQLSLQIHKYINVP